VLSTGTGIKKESSINEGKSKWFNLAVYSLKKQTRSFRAAKEEEEAAEVWTRV